MRQGDGSSRESRIERIQNSKPLAIIDDSVLSLVRRALSVAGSIRFYDTDNMPSGYFDEVLGDLKEKARELEETGEITMDGEMEPSAALLMTFIQNLHRTTAQFNDRWSSLPFLYVNDILGIVALSPIPYCVWVRFVKSVQDTVRIEKGCKFTLNCPDIEEPVMFDLRDEMELGNIEVRNAYSVFYDRQPNLYPAAQLGCVTSLEIKNLITDGSHESSMFSSKRDMTNSQSPGFIISSSGLLLREGQRSVTLRLETETKALTDFIEHIEKGYMAVKDMPRETIFYKLLNNIFNISISTSQGWTTIDNVTIKKGETHDNTIIIRFILAEDFPSTTGCTVTQHGIQSRFPAIKIHLDLDAWLYPYSWIKNFILKRVVIDTKVSGVSSIQVYNELGRIDNSKPFIPFGVNTERGAWMALGCYEMAVKNTSSFNLNIQWDQLPDNISGLYGHYEQYKENINNGSFKIEARYLNDYKWHRNPEQQSIPLFGTEPQSDDGLPLEQAPLTKESILRNISMRKMSRTTVDEQLFDYGINTKTGFISLVLTDPPIGFGEKRYRQLFTEMILKKSLKKSIADPVNTPINPFIERITIDYQAQDQIDLRHSGNSHFAAFWHIHPLGIKKVYPNDENKSIPLIYSSEENAALILELDNVKGGEYLRLYFEFKPLNRRLATGSYPNVMWYWGDGYSWSLIPDEVIIRDTTKNLCTSGCVELNLPDNIPFLHSSSNNTLWIRAAVTTGYIHIPSLANIYTNAAELIMSSNTEHSNINLPEMKGCTIEALKRIPGIKSTEQISAMHGGRNTESDLSKLIRVSENSTHRSKAVTPRDFELIVLEEFPEVAKIKCLSALDTKGNSSGVVTLVALPVEAKITKKGWRPKLPSSLILKIEQYLTEHCSGYISRVDIINPRYEEVMIRCCLTFKQRYSSGSCRFRLRDTCNKLIAPWQENRGIPSFNQKLRTDIILETILNQEYVERIDELEIIHIVKSGNSKYRIDEYGTDNEIITPSAPYAVLVPAAEHLFICNDAEQFGINEMTVGYTLVVESHNDKTL